MHILHDYDLTEHTTLKLPVIVKYFCIVASEQDLIEISVWCHTYAVRMIPIGESSNCIWSQYIDACVVKIALNFVQITELNNDSVSVEAGAGLHWDDFVQSMIERNYAGLQALSAIPGSIGAVPVQNVGAYGTEVSDLIDSIYVFNRETRQCSYITHTECGFGYRTSNFKTVWAGRFVILSVVFVLARHFTGELPNYGSTNFITDRLQGREITLQSIRDIITEIRWSKLPKPELLPNCGSFFVNPSIPRQQFEMLKLQFPDLVSFQNEQNDLVKISAGWMIEHAGWRGKSVGHFAMYQGSALVLVHTGGGSNRELWDFVSAVQSSVQHLFGILLTPEPNHYE